MLSTLLRLLGPDAPKLRRYLWMASAYGALSGLTISALVPVVSNLLHGNGQVAQFWLLALFAGAVVCWWARRHVEHAGVQVGAALLQGARQRLGEHIAQLPAGWFSPHNTAHLGHTVTQGMMAVAQLPAHVFTPVITGIIVPLVLVATLLVLHWQLGLTALAGLALLVPLIALSARLAKRADAAFQQRFARTSQRMVEFARAQPVLRAFNGDGESLRLLQRDAQEQRQSARRLIWLSASASVLNSWAVQALFASLLVVAVWLALPSTPPAQAVALVVALVLVTRYIDALLDVVGYSEVLRGARSQLDAIQALFQAQPLPNASAQQRPQDASIALQNVRFAYSPAGPEVLRDVSLRIEPGSMTALIGASGSGKSTLLRLLPRAFDVSAGRVLIGGADVRHIPANELATQFSQIFQDNYLFAGSIADNIAIGRPDASTDELLEAAHLAGLDEVIARLPDALATQVGEGGTRLSGGERQRIAIARALIKDAPILLVDEATAALDAENQAIIADTLQRLRGKRTLVIIAHQLSTIAGADQILVLEQGQIVEQGAPAALLERRGRYAHFLAQRRAAKGWRITEGDA